MWIKGKLSKEIMGLFAATLAISVFCFLFLSHMANAIAVTYCEKFDITLSEMQEITMSSWIQSVSFLSAGILFIVLFLFLLGQKLSYLQKIIYGIDALREHRMDYEMPIEGENELTELARSINYLSKTERELKEKEEEFIRNMSHDIRTPLTTILSYTEYMQEKGTITQEEIEVYLTLMRQKGEQMKGLTARLLDSEECNVEWIENGSVLMEQLAWEWDAALEEKFECEIEMGNCPAFSGEYDIQELRRIFDNLVSNVQKYADSKEKVYLRIFEEEGHLVLEQKNHVKANDGTTESNKIGLESIKKIAENYDGNVTIVNEDRIFTIRIVLFRIL